MRQAIYGIYDKDNKVVAFENRSSNILHDHCIIQNFINTPLNGFWPSNIQTTDALFFCELNLEVL